MDELKANYEMVIAGLKNMLADKDASIEILQGLVKK
jgi:hypothetical protein